MGPFVPVAQDETGWKSVVLRAKSTYVSDWEPTLALETRDRP